MDDVQRWGPVIEAAPPPDARQAGHREGVGAAVQGGRSAQPLRPPADLDSPEQKAITATAAEWP
ncbi:hypothetical protein [Mycolicibacterium baixiangningiae]|uniref:hypothetical protein n=1 Tax=Mycolicibacterium baixiangningiae TaxID=2761578 RepID=UPI0018696644|nr:hypothetical protein [Mycolicibacterium baixiangningiae]